MQQATDGSYLASCIALHAVLRCLQGSLKRLQRSTGLHMAEQTCLRRAFTLAQFPVTSSGIWLRHGANHLPAQPPISNLANTALQEQQQPEYTDNATRKGPHFPIHISRPAGGRPGAEHACYRLHSASAAPQNACACQCSAAQEGLGHTCSWLRASCRARRCCRAVISPPPCSWLPTCVQSACPVCNAQPASSPSRRVLAQDQKLILCAVHVCCWRCHSRVIGPALRLDTACCKP